MTQDVKTSLKSGLNLIVYDNILICNGVICRQLHGAPMCSLVSNFCKIFPQTIGKQNFHLKAETSILVTVYG